MHPIQADTPRCPSLTAVCRAVLFAAVLSGIAGCGNKGPLYLPSSPEAQTEAPDEAAHDADTEQGADPQGQ